MQLAIANEAALQQLAGQLAALIDENGGIITLQGDLGMGKTVWVRAMLHAWGYQGAVKSPTYTLVEAYTFSRFQVYHFDLYRLGDAEELEYLGIRDYFCQGSLCLIEWPQRGQGILPVADLAISLSPGVGAEQRVVGLSAGSERGRHWLQGLQAVSWVQDAITAGDS